jgi:hypothetical protein
MCRSASEAYCADFCQYMIQISHCSIHHRFSRCDNQMSRSLMKGSFPFIRPIFPLPGCLFRLEASLDVTPRFPLHRYQWRRERLGTAPDTRLGAYCSTQHKRHRVALQKSGRPQARCCVSSPFPPAPRRTAHARFRSTRLSSVFISFGGVHLPVQHEYLHGMTDKRSVFFVVGRPC